MDFELETDKVFSSGDKEKYINECCVGCDEILEALAPTFAKRFGVEQETFAIYQEDWGWALEFEKDGVAYHTGIANQSNASGLILFRVVGEAQRKEKGWIFTKRVKADTESAELATVVVAAAEAAGFDIRETEFPAED
jgi:hypothetical protein